MSESESLSADLLRLEKAWDRDWSAELGFLEDHLVRTPGTRNPFCNPYLPWIGPGYRHGGILLMATAQNLGQFQDHSSEDHLERWRVATGWPDRTLRRLEHPSFEEWRSVPIQPWMDGIMTVLAGLWMFAESGDAPGQLEDIASRVAVTNYFKHSLSPLYS